MSNVCSKCGREFNSSRAGQKMCPSCLNQEFTVAARLEDAEVEVARERQQAAAKRQHARMAKLLESYKNGTMFNMSGKIMFCVGLFIYGFCQLIFFLDSRGMIYWGVEGMELSGKQTISLLLSLASVLLLMFSTRRFKAAMLLVSVILLGLGWAAPMLWTSSRGDSEDSEFAAVKHIEQKADNDIVQPVTEEELDVFYEVKKRMPRATHYAFFMDNQDPIVRGLVRDALTRLLDAEYTRAYTRTNGILYVVANASVRNAKPVAERLGSIVNSDAAKGLYIVRFDAEKTNLVCKFSSEVLSSPLNASFVTANISELQCLDAMRIRVAARSLKNADVQMLRTEIRDALVRVLGDPWSQDQDTWVALIDALVTYAPRKDSQAIAICFNYFNMRYQAKKEVLPSVANYLIAEQPEKMVDPVITYWLSNPMAWTQQIKALSWRVQPRLLNLMEGEASIKDLNLILRYLQTNGTSDAIPAVRKLMEHQDSIIRYTARTTLNALEKKDNEEGNE